MIESSKVKKILYGGDYNPEQWPEDIWEEDMRMLRLASIDVVTLNVFNWAMLQPHEDVYDFGKLDRIMDMVRENGLKVCMATSTAVHPAWMARKYPDVLRTEHNGIRRKFGSRHNSCPNSPTYRKYSVLLAEKLAGRYKDYDNIVAWHVSNEYGGECYCENCEKAFRRWLTEKYGTVEELNRVWNMAFWGHTLYDFEDVVAPNMQSEEFLWDTVRTNFQGISLDYRRFMSDSMLSCYRMEYEVLKKYMPDVPITTNLMGFYKLLDYQKWGRYMDFVSWDNYPSFDTPVSESAMNHELMRGLKQGKPFALMEQTPGVSNWQSFCTLKRPGVMRLLSYQAIAHGSDTVMFFQMRRSIGACEKYHSAVIDHAGHENTRVFREVAKLGEELNKLGGQTLGTRTAAKAAIVMDWDNWWASGYSAGPSRLIDYKKEIFCYYRAFYENNIPVDIISVTDDLSIYRLVTAPLLYMCKEGFDEKVRSYVKDGGRFLTTYFSGYVEDHDLVITGGYPGKLRDILGIWVEESDAIPEGKHNSFLYKGETYPAEVLCDLLHLEGAEALSRYQEDFYAGMPALTSSHYGKGRSYYAATRSTPEFYRTFVKDICEEAEIPSLLQIPAGAADGIEISSRENETDKFLFILNHNDKAVNLTITLSAPSTDILTETTYLPRASITIQAKDVVILKSARECERGVKFPAQ